MIGDAYKIKYSDYVLNLDGTDNGRFIEIEATDYTSRPGVNTTNLNHSNPVKRVPLDVVLYGYRSRGYGAPLWNNLFYLLENFAQPSEVTSIFPKYDKNPTHGQIWVDTTSETAVPRWYGRDNKFYKLGASVNIAANASQAAPGELWFDTSTYALRSYDTGWSDISCIPYASQREYNALATSTNALTTIPGTLPILTGAATPTPALWASLITNVRLLAQANGVIAPTSTVDVLAAGNFMICNAGIYGVAMIKSIFSQIRTSIDAIDAIVHRPTQLPLAGFVASATTGVLPLVVNFTDTSTQTAASSSDPFGPTRYTWNFGDGTVSTTAGNTSHTYTTAGSHTVTLTLVNSVGTTSTQTVINSTGLPVAQFLVGPDSNPDISTTAPFTLVFTDQSTGSPTSWLWDFGDGTISSNRNPTHVYSTLGDFTVSLLVTNAAGSNTATVTHAVQVGEPTIANFTYTTPTRLTGDTSPFSVTFTDTTTKSPASWLWNFGDGTTSTQQNPTHTYTSWGRFTVSLTATNALSNTPLDSSHTSVKTMIGLVNVGLAPTSAFTLSSSVGSLPITVTATDTSTNTPTSWSWDFGDGSPVINTQQASHTYTTYGTRTVTLIATNIVGSHTSTQTITVTPPAVVTSFGHQMDGSTVPVTVTYTDTSSNSPTSWLWNFGDGTTSTLQNPTHTYTNPGTYTTTLTAVNFAGGNSNSIAVTANAATFAASIVIQADEQNVNIRSKLLVAGWDGVLPVVGSISIGSGIVVSASSTAQYALRTGGALPAGSDFSIINNGYIVGMGGAGGTGQMRVFDNSAKYGAMNVTVAAANGASGGPALGLDGGTIEAYKLYNYGVIGGGGGGGGGAASNLNETNMVNHVGTFITGGLTISPGGGGGQTGRTNSDGGAGGFGSYPGTFNGPGGALVPTGHGNSGAGGSWGASGAQGSAWPGDYVASNGGGGGAAVVGANGFILPLGTWGTYYGAIA